MDTRVVLFKCNISMFGRGADSVLVYSRYHGVTAQTSHCPAPAAQLWLSLGKCPALLFQHDFFAWLTIDLDADKGKKVAFNQIVTTEMTLSPSFLVTWTICSLAFVRPSRMEDYNFLLVTLTGIPSLGFAVPRAI